MISFYFICFGLFLFYLLWFIAFDFLVLILFYLLSFIFILFALIYCFWFSFIGFVYILFYLLLFCFFAIACRSSVVNNRVKTTMKIEFEKWCSFSLNYRPIICQIKLVLFIKERNTHHTPFIHELSKSKYNTLWHLYMNL